MPEFPSLTMDAAYFSETLVSAYKTTLCVTTEKITVLIFIAVENLKTF
jgi:hypothetical protein